MRSNRLFPELFLTLRSTNVVGRLFLRSQNKYIIKKIINYIKIRIFKLGTVRFEREVTQREQREEERNFAKSK